MQEKIRSEEYHERAHMVLRNRKVIAFYLRRNVEVIYVIARSPSAGSGRTPAILWEYHHGCYVHEIASPGYIEGLAMTKIYARYFRRLSIAYRRFNHGDPGFISELGKKTRKTFPS